MKRFAVVFFLFFGLKAFAQSGNGEHFIAEGTKARLYSVDGHIYFDTLSTQRINKIKAADIVEIYIVSQPEETAIYGLRGAKGVTFIATKQYATTWYQQTLSGLSKKYKTYIDLKGSDSKLLYVVNDTMLTPKLKSTIVKLYHLTDGKKTPDDANHFKDKKIQKVNFKTDSRFTTDATIEITTN